MALLAAAGHGEPGAKAGLRLGRHHCGEVSALRWLMDVVFFSCKYLHFDGRLVERHFSKVDFRRLWHSLGRLGSAD